MSSDPSSARAGTSSEHGDLGLCPAFSSSLSRTLLSARSLDNLQAQMPRQESFFFSIALLLVA
jgi:hypothetical protein